MKHHPFARLAATITRGSGRLMARWYRLYCQIAALVFVLVTVYNVPTKLLHGRLADDWTHSLLHLGSGLLGAYVG